MNRVIVILAVALFAAPMCSQECGSSDCAQLHRLTEMARTVIETGSYTGWDEKAFVRAGDLGAVAIVRALPKSELIDHMQMRSVLLLLRTSFSCLDRCVQSPDEREPRVASLLLEYLRQHGSADTLSQIEEVQTFILKQAEIGKNAK
jgi:hypothetical protein